MDFNSVIESRRAIRKYRKDPVSKDSISKLYHALRLAPSGNNRQPYRFIFVTDPQTRRDIAQKACHQSFIMDAPILMIACCDAGRSFDTAIAVDHLILAAANERLGTCWVGWFERDVVKEILGIPSDLEVPIIIPIGYSDENPEPRPRKSIEELVTYNHY